jgi:hypothetical protein
MRKFLLGLCLLIWPIVAVADDAPILLQPPLPEGLVPPQPSSHRFPVPRPPDNVLNGHAIVDSCFVVDVGSDGHTTNVIVLKHSHLPDFDDAMAKSLRAVRWKPAQLDGKPVAVRMLLDNIFQGFTLAGPELARQAKACSWDLYKDLPDSEAVAPQPPQ